MNLAAEAMEAWRVLQCLKKILLASASSVSFQSQSILYIV
jgi:hypothetical protein